MFTGIARGRGKITQIEGAENLIRIGVDITQLLSPPFIHGNSVMINGVCLSIVAAQGNILYFDVIPETLQKTNLGTLKPGDVVNVEGSLKLGDELGGHQVQGHVEGTAEIIDVQKAAHDVRLYFRLHNKTLISGCIPKGYVAVDGVSLTIATLDRKKTEFSVALIPDTLAKTTLGIKGQGDIVNIETDMAVKTIVHTIESMREDILKLLQEK